MADQVTIPGWRHDQLYRDSVILHRLNIKLAMIGRSDLMRDAEREYDEDHKERKTDAV